MQQAKGQLNQGQPQSAHESMAQAAQAARAGRPAGGEQDQQQSHDAPPDQPHGRFSDNGRRRPAARPDKPAAARGRSSTPARPWGELPGELRTKIVQQMRVKYGDDYARMIKLYFEQAADTRDRK